MSKEKIVCSIILLIGTFIGSVSQVFLKKSSQRIYKSVIEEYLNPLVAFAYLLFILTTLISIVAYKGIPLSMGPVLDSTSYLYISIFGVKIFGERITKKKFMSLILIVGGIVVYSLCG